MPGFERGRKLDKIGQPESDTAELFFADVRVPAANVIGEIDRGFVYMMERLVAERIGAAVSNVAHARQILDETLAYVKERQAFGQPIGSFQANKSQARRAGHPVRGDPGVRRRLPHAAGSPDADAGRCRQGQVVVGRGAERDPRRLRPALGRLRLHERVPGRPRLGDARVTRIWAGSNEIMKELIGRDLGL